MTNPTWRTPFEQALAEGRVPGFKPARHVPRASSRSDFTMRVEKPSATLEVGQRGLVLAAPVIFHQDGRFSTTQYDRHHLQAALLFWDALDYPTNTAIGIGDPDLEALAKMGALQQTRVVVNGYIQGPGVIADAHLAAFEVLDSASPGRWSLGRLPNSGSFPASELIDNGGLSVKLTNAIPLPGREVPFEDLLDFRARRRPELLALRAHLDQVCHIVSTAPDSDRALVAAIDELDRAVTDQMRVTSESFKISRLIDFDAGFNIADAARTALPSIGGLMALGLPLATAALGGLGAGAVAGLKADIRPGRRKSKDSSPFEYVVQLNREIG